MKRRLFLLPTIALAVVTSAAAIQAQEAEVFMMSYPNANITVDGDPSDWNLEQFQTTVVGGLVPAGGTRDDWGRVGGTGDVALLGWDDDEGAVFYGSAWANGVLPEERSDNQAKFYARDNATTQYFLVDIFDDEINTDDEAAWANDSVEFYFDPTEDGGNTPGGNPAWESDVQLVIDAGNQVQVWNSPESYELILEAGVESVVTMTDDGWMLEVGIDKRVFNPPLPSFLGDANDPDGNNYGIDFSYRDNDDPEDTGTRNGDTNFTTAYVWADPTVGGGFPSKLPDLWGQMIAGESDDPPPPTLAGDANGDGIVNATDLNIVGSNWQMSVDPPGPANGDFDNSGFVDAADLNVIGTNWQSTAAPANAAVPEPSSSVLLVLGGLTLLMQRRK